MHVLTYVAVAVERNIRSTPKPQMYPIQFRFIIM